MLSKTKLKTDNRLADTSSMQGNSVRSLSRFAVLTPVMFIAITAATVTPAGGWLRDRVPTPPRVLAGSVTHDHLVGASTLSHLNEDRLTEGVGLLRWEPKLLSQSSAGEPTGWLRTNRFSVTAANVEAALRQFTTDPTFRSIVLHKDATHAALVASPAGEGVNVQIVLGHWDPAQGADELVLPTDDEAPAAFLLLDAE
jgi:hypothetical protein